MRFTSRQWWIVLLIAAVQFINILDFMIMMPMGPLLAKALHFSEADAAMANASYTAAAGLAGLVGSFFLDRFDRRLALAVALAGLVTGTAAGALATGLPTLMAARVIAGLFGGPATSLAFSIVADAIPNQLRGRAMGIVMGAFSVASVVGVPIGLYLAETLGWRAPFLAVASLGALVCVGAVLRLPPMRAHLDGPARPVGSMGELLARPLVRASYAMTALVMLGGFLVIFNIAPYLMLNLELPEPKLKFAYLWGGIASFFATQLGGRAVDRFGSLKVGTVGVLGFIAVVVLAFAMSWSAVAPWVVNLGFVAFMTATGLRNVAYNTLASKVPEPAVRARFQSLQSAVQNGSSSAAGFLSALLLTTEGPEGARRLVGMGRVVFASVALSALIPALLFIVERGVKRRGAATTPGPVELVAADERRREP